mmetsp:Transcript_50552/g.114831  ORF Transcript_50552/g.114831 Transcript_50552/m.114831 type:complete len:460 (+) Transcript_50552:3375-4754(+)
MSSAARDKKARSAMGGSVRAAKSATSQANRTRTCGSLAARAPRSAHAAARDASVPHTGPSVLLGDGEAPNWSAPPPSRGGKAQQLAGRRMSRGPNTWSTRAVGSGGGRPRFTRQASVASTPTRTESDPSSRVRGSSNSPSLRPRAAWRAPGSSHAGRDAEACKPAPSGSTPSRRARTTKKKSAARGEKGSSPSRRATKSGPSTSAAGRWAPVAGSGNVYRFGAVRPSFPWPPPPPPPVVSQLRSSKKVSEASWRRRATGERSRRPIRSGTGKLALTACHAAVSSERLTMVVTMVVMVSTASLTASTSPAVMKSPAPTFTTLKSASMTLPRSSCPKTSARDSSLSWSRSALADPPGEGEAFESAERLPSAPAPSRWLTDGVEAAAAVRVPAMVKLRTRRSGPRAAVRWSGGMPRKSPPSSRPKSAASPPLSRKPRLHASVCSASDPGAAGSILASTVWQR